MQGLPLRIEEITPAWLGSALSQWFPGTRVAAIEDMIVIRGTATKIRLVLRYEQVAPDGPPTHLCVKGGFDEELRALVSGAYCLEAEFYARIVRANHVPLPRCWFAAAEPDRGQGIIILDDIVHAGGHFNDPVQPWSIEKAAAALDVLAQLHGTTWNARREQYPWVPALSPLRELTPWLYDEENWRRTLSEPFADFIPSSLRDPKRLLQAQLRMWQEDDASLCSLNHADPHIGNTYFDREGQPRFVDWQVVNLAPGADDVAYFLSGVLTVDDRRRHEQALLRGYLDSLQRFGAPAPDFDAFWLDYRKHLVHGFLWVVTPSSMQTTARVGAMTERHVAAMMDHDTLNLIENH